MIVLITYIEDNVTMVSHGINDNDRLVILPNLPLMYYNAKWNRDLAEWILEE